MMFFTFIFLMQSSCLRYVTTVYTHDWAVKIEGGKEAAVRISEKHGFVNMGKIVGDYYLFRQPRIAKRSLELNKFHGEILLNDPQVVWAQQQKVKIRVKRDNINKWRQPPTFANDPLWPNMWYLNRGPNLDMNVKAAWDCGVTGKNVVVTILDDGIEGDHPDLQQNYDKDASYDVNDHDDNPIPRYDSLDSNRHGTRCAGEVAAVFNNSICAVGIAFDAKVGGVRMLDGDVTDAVEAKSLSLNPEHIDIYSASWGPDDDGKTVDGPGKLATEAFISGIRTGRKGKGSIFVWASGNGGSKHDNCNCDGYTNSIWTLSISSATENGHVPWYSEACSSTLATTYSSGEPKEQQCTLGHTGTSASAPLAAGICALALSANQELTWRDMQHIVVRTARMANLKSDDWQVNGVGRKVSHSFGYGLLDAAAMVQLSKIWETVPKQLSCLVPSTMDNKSVPGLSKIRLPLKIDSTNCPDIMYMEHVQANITLSTQRRGDIQIYLTSPSGTRSTLLASRPHDTSKAGFNGWPFMAVHFWGEHPNGVWYLEIHNKGATTALLNSWDIIIYGTLEEPCKGCSESSSSNSDSSGLGFQVTQETSSSSMTYAPALECLLKDISGMCLACIEGAVLVQGMCMTSCPLERYFYEIKKGSAWCSPCHFSCRTCRGSNNYECDSCFEDYVLYTSPSNASRKHCYFSNLVNELKSAYYWYATLIIFFSVLLLLILGILFLQCKSRNKNCHSYYNDVLYTKSDSKNMSNTLELLKSQSTYIPLQQEE